MTFRTISTRMLAASSARDLSDCFAAVHAKCEVDLEAPPGHRSRWLSGACFSVVFLHNLLPGVVLRAGTMARERSSVIGRLAATIDIACVDERSGRPG